MKKFYVPSFQIERKTKAMNPYLWGFAALISMFVFVLLVLAPHLFLVSFLEIVSTFLYDHMTLIVPAIIMIFALMFGIGLFQFLNALLYAYTIDENRIVRGKITNQAADMNVALDVLAVKYMIKHLDEPQKVNAAQTASNMFRIIRRIQYNMNEAFVREYFDTDVYQSKVYENPQLIKETKYKFVYQCGKKKISIPKIYEGMDISNRVQKESSIMKRIISRTVFIGIICMICSGCDLLLSAQKNPQYEENILQASNELRNSLTDFGYSNQERNERGIEFRKVINDEKTSVLRYFFDREGQLIDAEIQLYFDEASFNEEEMKFIIHSLQDNFSEAEINDFILEIESCLQDACEYGKLQSEKHILRIGTSEGYIDIHNY